MNGSWMADPHGLKKLNKISNGVLRHVVQGLYKGASSFHNVLPSYGTRVHEISFKTIRRERSCFRRFSRNSQAFSSIMFHLDWTINVDSADRHKLKLLHTVQLSVTAPIFTKSQPLNNILVYWMSHKCHEIWEVLSPTSSYLPMVRCRGVTAFDHT